MFRVWGSEKIMADFEILIGILASGSIMINLYLIKSLSNLCMRLARVEGSLNHK